MRVKMCMINSVLPGKVNKDTLLPVTVLGNS